MNVSARHARRIRAAMWSAAPAVAAAGLVVWAAPPVAANVAVTQVSSDPYTNTASQHRTEVEPDTYAFGSTSVSAFQVGRISNGGAANIGWATSRDGGATWTRGFLPGITTTGGGGSNFAASDPSVAFDARHNVWLISSLVLGSSGSASGVVTSRSTNGGLSWSNPVTTTTGSVDKNWIACDNTSTSPFYGHCYTEYDVTSAGNAIRLRTSTDGGLTWGPARASGDNASGLGGQPVVRPNGTVIMPYLSGNQIRSFRSIDGGASWRASVLVANVTRHTVAGGIRAQTPLPSAEIDAAGTVYVAFQDCRFRSGCTANDILLSKSTSETTWAAPVRVPIDSTTSGRDHFVPGIGVDRSTSGSSARLSLTYYFYPVASCTASTCQLDVGSISSTNGGSTWSAATQLAGPMTLSWLPSTTQGRMFGDYISTSVVPGGRAYPVIPIARAPSGGLFDVAMYVPTGGLAVSGGTQRAVPATAAVPARPAAPAARGLTAH